MLYYQLSAKYRAQRNMDEPLKANPLIVKDPHSVDLNRSAVNRIFWFISGLISMIVGLIGIPVPGLPTTPLMILAAACFARSNQRFYDWIINNKLFGHHVKNYREGKGIPKTSKPLILLTLWGFVLFAVFYAIPDDVAVSKIGTLVLAIIGTIFILRIPSFEDSQTPE
tara:strand:+ start:533 stop:1036 length:504 start_codon:yes stop_codon:yes gene_type:complete